jgi:antitoxin component YwqK of YwqJK toxin-antitoxin module
LVKGSYKNAKVDGLYEMYHRNGELEVKRIYKNGIEISCEGKCN